MSLIRLRWIPLCFYHWLVVNSVLLWHYLHFSCHIFYFLPHPSSFIVHFLLHAPPFAFPDSSFAPAATLHVFTLCTPHPTLVWGWGVLPSCMQLAANVVCLPLSIHRGRTCRDWGSFVIITAYKSDRSPVSCVRLYVSVCLLVRFWLLVIDWQIGCWMPNDVPSALMLYS